MRRGAANGFALHFDAAGAGKGFAFLRLVFVERGRHGKHLENGARVVGVCQKAVAAQFVELCGIIARRVVQIIAFLIAHGENFPGFGVHRHAHHALRAVFGVGVRTGFFHE